MRALPTLSLIYGATMIVAGVAVLETPEAAKVSALAGLVRLTPGAVNTDLVGGSLAAVGFLAVLSAALWRASPAMRLLLLVPAQLVMIVQMRSIGGAILSGAYPDGYVPAGGPCSILWDVGSCFILTDQILTFVFLAAHAFYFAWVIVNPGPHCRRYFEEEES